MDSSIKKIIETYYNKLWSVRLEDQMIHFKTLDVCLKDSIETCFKYFLLLGEAMKRIIALHEHKDVLLTKHKLSKKQVFGTIESAKEHLSDLRWSFEFLMTDNDDWFKQPIDQQMVMIESEHKLDDDLKEKIRLGLWHCLRIGAVTGERQAEADVDELKNKK
jgi:hypothetical protein